MITVVESVFVCFSLFFLILILITIDLLSKKPGLNDYSTTLVLTFVALILIGTVAKYNNVVRYFNIAMLLFCIFVAFTPEDPKADHRFRNTVAKIVLFYVFVSAFYQIIFQR